MGSQVQQLTNYSDFVAVLQGKGTVVSNVSIDFLGNNKAENLI